MKLEWVHDRRRIAWLCPRDAFVLGSLEDAAQQIEDDFKYETFFLDDRHAMVILLGDDLSNTHQDFELESFAFKKRAQLQDFLRRNFIAGKIPAMSLWMPDDKYWVECFLPDAERESRDCMFMHVHLQAILPMVFRVYNTRPLPDEHFRSLKAFIECWYQRACTTDVRGEVLTEGSITFSRVQIAATQNSPQKVGYDITFPYPKGVTWPWMELYVNARSSFSVRKRPSFEFVRSRGWSAA